MKTIIKIKKQLLLILAFYICQPILSNTHFIITYDLFVGKNDKFDYNVLLKLDNTLNKLGFNKETDFVSIMAYGLDFVNPKIDSYVLPCKDINNKAIVWRKLNKDDTVVNLLSVNKRNKGLPNKGLSLKAGSMQTIAKQYSLTSTLLHQNNNIEVCVDDSTFHPVYFASDSTYLLVVSDMWYNGSDDYIKEWKSCVESVPYEKGSRLKSLEKEVFMYVKDVNDNFKFNLKSQIAIYPQNSNNYSIAVYDVVPNERPSVHSVTDLPSPIPLKRVRGGFTVNLDVKVNQMSNYTVERMHIYRNDTNIDLAECEGSKLNSIISKDDIKVGDTICLGMTLHFKDGKYNGTLISDTDRRFHDGMTVKQNVTLPDEAKIMGVFPLRDFMWWWFPNDCFSAVMLWDLIIILISIAVLCFLFYKWFIKITTYKPSNKNLKIRKI